MYNQLMNDINRHLNMIWQPVAVLIATFAILTVTKEIGGEKGIIPLDYAAVLIVLICMWAGFNFVDASYWYNRNLVMVANIERQFLRRRDAEQIHYYFTQHRPDNRMISFVKIQSALAVGVATVVLLFHALVRVKPTCCSMEQPIDWLQILPYGVACFALLAVNYVRNDCKDKYEEFIKLSPGAPVEKYPKTSKGHGGRRTVLQVVKLAFRIR